jgi:hypothetical protein
MDVVKRGFASCPRPLLRSVTAVSVFLALACAPKVRCFRVMKHPAPPPSPSASPQCARLPLKLCGPGLVDVRWEAKGTATLFSNPGSAATCLQVPPNGRVASKGSTTCQVNATTALTMRAGPSLTAPVWWKYDTGLTQITVGPVPAPLGKTAACTPAGYEAVVPRDPLEWDPEFKVLTVSVAGELLKRLREQSGLKLRVSHAGRDDTLDASKSSTPRFRCAPYGGDWTLTLSESPGKNCADEPLTLTIQVATACGPCSPGP